MNRCTLLLTCALLAAPAAQAQPRPFPDAALRGVLQITNPPEVLLDGKADRLSPGSRIRGVRNELVMSGGLIGERFVVNYTREAHGLVHDVWLLTPEEAALKRRGASTGRNFVFESEIPRQ